MKSNYLDSLSDKKFQNAWSDMLADAAREAWSGKPQNEEKTSLESHRQQA